MVATAEETRDVGAKTLQELDSQGDQLRKVNQELDEINQDLKATEKTLTQMERCCGCCLCPCCASRNFERGNKQYNEAFSKQPRDELVTDQPGVESARATGGVRYVSTHRTSVESVTTFARFPKNCGYRYHITPFHVNAILNLLHLSLQNALLCRMLLYCVACVRVSWFPKCAYRMMRSTESTCLLWNSPRPHHYVHLFAEAEAEVVRSSMWSESRTTREKMKWKKIWVQCMISWAT